MISAKKLGLLCALFFYAISPAFANISALGRVIPTDGVVDIWGPSGIQIETIHVTQGEVVEKGSLLATLSNQAQVQLELEQAELALKQANLAYELEIELQDAILKGMEVDLVNASKRLKHSYKNKDMISPQVIEEREETVTSIENSIARAKASKKKVLTLLDLDREAAKKNLESAQSLMASSEIRAPIKGTILIVRKAEGSTLGRGEFIKLADTSRMSISAEVYESDISKISLGQKARIESVAIDGTLTGKVSQKGLMLFTRSVDSLDARSLTNSRVIEVIVELDNPQKVEHLSYLQVDVFID